ncbi:MAG: phosphoglycerate kinase [Immundisolibacteraceae bacterium]|nr:phosphoglycerate kinase [Immundisolibacteraceae bacterium]
MASYARMADLELANQRLLIRVDLNVPMADGKISDDSRIRAVLPTLRMALERGAGVLLLSHLGRPQEGQFDSQLSLAPVADALAELLEIPVPLVSDWQQVEIKPGVVFLAENVRFNVGELADEDALAQQLASRCDLFVMDAFGTAHRAHASTHGVAKFAPRACAGPLLDAELKNISQALENPARPLVAIVGGSKVSTKLEVLRSLIDKVDRLIVGGGMTNTFLAAAGYEVGRSLYEPDMMPMAIELMRLARQQGVELAMPDQVICAPELSTGAPAIVYSVNEVPVDQMILDLGTGFAVQISAELADAGTIIWNGPLGAFEFDQFGESTRLLAEGIAASPAFSIAGGGDTLAAIAKYGVVDQISYISTGGGAFLEMVEGKVLPAVEVLQHRYQ